MSENKFAIVNIFGRQFKVAEGDKIKASLTEANSGEKITFSEVLMLNSGKGLKVGSPTVSGAKVVAEVVEHGRDDKVIVVDLGGLRRCLSDPDRQRRRSL